MRDDRRMMLVEGFAAMKLCLNSLVANVSAVILKFDTFLHLELLVEVDDVVVDWMELKIEIVKATFRKISLNMNLYLDCMDLVVCSEVGVISLLLKALMLFQD